MKTKINLLNLSILVILGCLAFLLYKFGHFSHIGDGFSTEPQTINHTASSDYTDVSYISTAETRFTFFPDRHRVSGLIMEIRKKTYIENQKEIDVLIESSYTDRISGEKKSNITRFPFKLLNLGGLQTLNFSEPLEDVYKQKVETKIRLSENPSKESALFLNNNKYYLIYSEKVSKIIYDSLENFRNDKKFSSAYTIFFWVMLISVVFLLLFESRKVDDSKR